MMIQLKTVRRLSAALVLGASLALAGSGYAGGTPENAVLIIDPTDAISMEVGNYYKNTRNIPDCNVLYMRSAAANYSTFISTNQEAFIGSIRQRRIVDHADYAVLAPLNAFFISATGGFPDTNRISIPAAYEAIQISDLVNSGPSHYSTSKPNYFGAVNAGSPNSFLYPSNLPALAFDAEQAYLNGSPSTDPSAQRYYIGAMLGYTGANGNTAEQLLTMIDRSVGVDGTRPAGTFYFMNNTADNLRNSRACGSIGGCPTPTLYNATAASIGSLGGSAQVLNGVLPPTSTTNIMGIMSGFANANIPGANLTLVPGAFCDELTSFAAEFNSGQTKVSEWITAGASGSAGSVHEPSAIPRKFPSADFHKYYFEGMSLGEAYLRSVVYFPLEMMVYGDPLTRPFAYIPSVSVASPPIGNQSGIITITPTASTTKPDAAIASYDLLVDGVKMAGAGLGQSFTLDTAKLADGRHDLRVLAYDDSAVKNVGRWIGTLDTNNYGRSAILGGSTGSGDLVQLFSFPYTATSADLREVRLMHNGRILAASTAASGTFSVYGHNLCAGVSIVKLEAWYNDDRFARSIPVTVNVASSGSAPAVVPVAYNYSKILASRTAYLVELPARYNTAPSGATYTLLNTPMMSTVLQSASTLPYVILKPNPGAHGTEQLQFRVTTPGGTSNIATVTLVYNTVTIIPAPTGFTLVFAYAGDHAQQGGVTSGGTNTHASLWSGTAASHVDLHPAGATGSIVYGISPTQQVGYATLSGGPHAALWSGTAASWVDLHPAGATDSRAYGTDGSQQVGFAKIGGASLASIWTGTPGSRVDLNPAGASESVAQCVSNGVQAGWARIGSSAHAGYWSGTAASWVDLNPPGATVSLIHGMYDATDEDEFVGYATIGGVNQASRWLVSWASLHPAGATASMANDTNKERQVGYAYFSGVSHAGFWRSSPESWSDLSALLPPQYAGYHAAAESISRDNPDIRYVTGWAQRAGGIDLIIWTVH